MNKYDRKRAQFLKKVRRVKEIQRKHIYDSPPMSMQEILEREDKIVKECGLKDREELMTLRMAITLVTLGKYKDLNHFFKVNVQIWLNKEIKH